MWAHSLSMACLCSTQHHVGSSKARAEGCKALSLSWWCLGWEDLNSWDFSGTLSLLVSPNGLCSTAASRQLDFLPVSPRLRGPVPKKVMQYHFCFLFIRSQSFSPAHVQREGNRIWKECQKFGHILKSPHIYLYLKYLPLNAFLRSSLG